MLILAVALVSPSFRAGAAMHDASALEWKLWGFRPNLWRMNFDFVKLSSPWAEVDGIPIDVPGSVQKALLREGIIKDWNIGLNYRDIEWIENREWLLATLIPDEWTRRDNPSEKIVIEFKGLDYKGIVYVNGRQAGTFCNAFIPYRFDITPFLRETGNTLVVAFECPPQNLAQIGWTSAITEWKPRFNYGWDWIPRIVQTGIWDDVLIGSADVSAPRLGEVQAICDASPDKDQGSLTIRFPETPGCKTRVVLTSPEGKTVLDKTLKEGTSEQRWDKLKVRRWWPNGAGEQPLYDLCVELISAQGQVIDRYSQKLGFRSVGWGPCKDAAPEADPWLCYVNGTPVFLQGIDWTPILPNFADLREADYERLLKTYKDLGINTIRVWGGGFAERDWLYDYCDKLGILVWQDFPLSSSGLDNYPPDTNEAIGSMKDIVDHYVLRLRNHPSLFVWCGGNELYELDNSAPVNVAHPMIAMMKERVDALDGTRRFVPGTPSGPTIESSREKFGKGISYDVHGPWNLPYSGPDMTMESVEAFWDKCDALFLSEVGAPGAASVELLNIYKGDCELLPAKETNPIWKSVNWWIQWGEYLAKGGDPYSLADYVAWSQKRQADGLVIALRKSKARFPACGGFLVWMGHDSFPCPLNTSIIDFDGALKPAAHALSAIWKTNPENL